MARTLIFLLFAALLETSDDALMRIGLDGRYPWLVAGAVTLGAYGIVVNQARLDFGRLMGAYIAVFFVVSQLLALALFHRTPDLKTVLGGLLIALGGVVIML